MIKIKAALYVRVSTDEQANEGFSIEAQKRRLTSYADSQDWEIADIYMDEGFSAKNLERPAIKELIKDVKLNKFDVVLVYKLDRMTRSTTDCDYLLKLFDRHDIKFQSATESFETRTATGRLFIRLVADIAQWERENTAERVRFGMEQMVVEGKRPGAKYPFGYDKEGNIIEDESKLIRELRELYMSGQGYKSIALFFNHLERLRRGHEWSAATVAYTLENPFYAGIIRLGSKKNDGTYANHKRDEKVKCLYGEGKHVPIFTLEEYEEHKSFMKRKSNNGYSQLKDYWFSGVLRCGRCGSAMFGRLTTVRSRISGEKVRTQYYICSKKHSGRTCDMPTFRQIHVEHLFMKYIENLIAEHELINKEAKKESDKKENYQVELSNTEKELNKIRERKKKWQYMRVNDEISSDDLKERMAEENEIELKIISKREALKSSSSPIYEIDKIYRIKKLWATLDDSEKKDLIYSLFSRIVVNTPLSKVKGVKNKFFDAVIQDISFN